MIGARGWVVARVDGLGEDGRLDRVGAVGVPAAGGLVLLRGDGAGVSVPAPLGWAAGVEVFCSTTIPGPKSRLGGGDRTRVSPAMTNPRTTRTTTAPVIRRALVLPMTPLWAFRMRRR